MTFWSSILPSYRRGFLNQSTKWTTPSASVSPTPTMNGATRATTSTAVLPAEMSTNQCPYSMMAQPQRLGLDEQVGWATYLEYI
eukprot:CAMPEP_0176270742 /NCGR_PEP_ID=MMETSP0121_2-20121125/44853_1 /TAXON_ID=160619 /ORGANISM="Kryptoperidinium foliaceum, Strain CCMP 1326" /LENGTH=83 /DNA_ID=CAMNT_0017610889 /DNA_START=106 /DNA_END=357 /DNA_ORIENTATION=+